MLMEAAIEADIIGRLVASAPSLVVLGWCVKLFLGHIAKSEDRMHATITSITEEFRKNADRDALAMRAFADRTSEEYRAITARAVASIDESTRVLVRVTTLMDRWLHEGTPKGEPHREPHRERPEHRHSGQEGEGG